VASQALLQTKMGRSLVTPEGIDLGVTLADMGQRAGAFLIDALLLLAAMIGLTILAAYSGGDAGGMAERLPAIIWLLGFFVLRNGYFIIMEMRPRAATFGKRWTGIRVVARDGGRLTGDAIIARNLMREIEVFLPLVMIVSTLASGDIDAAMAWLGVIWTGVFLIFPWLNKDRLRVGDLLAGTWVIRTKKAMLLDDLAATPLVSAVTFSHAQLDAYGTYELDTLDRVIRTGDPATRLTVAQSIIDKIGWPHEVRDIDPFLNAYYTQLRVRLERGLMMGKRRDDKHDVAIDAASSYRFSVAQLSVYGQAELTMLAKLLRSDDATTKLTVTERIMAKIGWTQDVPDIDAFLAAYYAQFRALQESGALAIAKGQTRR
jgi:uncharacterized RDD family membrane protein YckC